MQAIRRPAPFVLVSSGHGSLIVNRNDYCMVTPTSGYGVGYQLLNTGYFDPEEINVVLSILQLRRALFGDGVVALDCGANVGVHTVEWSKTMHGWGEVLAFEAQDRVFYALAGNIAINNCLNASAMHAALGSRPGEIGIPKVNYLQPSSFGSLELRQRQGNEFIGQAVDYSPENTSQIRMVSIDSLGLKRLDFIKIDVEGMELEVLDGAQNSIDRFHPALCIEAIKTDRGAMNSFLANHGYRTYDWGINVLAFHQSDPSTQHIKIN